MDQYQSQDYEVEERDPTAVILWSIFTLGIYAFYWYYKIYEDLEYLYGETPTGSSYWLDLLFTIITCGFYGLYVDYKISHIIFQLKVKKGMPGAKDEGAVIVLLDVFGYLNCYLTSFISSSLHQQQVNDIVKYKGEGKLPGPSAPPPPPPSGPGTDGPGRADDIGKNPYS